MKKIYLCLVFSVLTLIYPSLNAQSVDWIYLPNGETNGVCTSDSDYATSTVCFGLEYTPGKTGNVTSYTFGFLVDCTGPMGETYPSPYSSSCIMDDNTDLTDGCSIIGKWLFQAAGNNGNVAVTAGVPIIVQQICMNLPLDVELTVEEEGTTGITVSIDSINGGGAVDDVITFPPFIADDTGFGIVDCADTTVCSIQFNTEESRLSFTSNGNGNLADGQNISNSFPAPMTLDVYDEVNDVCQYAGGVDDLTVTFQIVNTADQNGNGIIDEFAGSTHNIVQDVNGLSAQIPFGQSALDETSSGDTRGYQIRVDFASHIEIMADDLTINLSGLNSNGVAFESARVLFYDLDGNVFDEANYQGYYGTATDLSGNCNPTSASADPWSITGTGQGVFVIDNTNTVDLSNPCGPVAGSGGSNLTNVNARLDAGLDSSTIVQGFSLVVVGEDLAAPSMLDDGSNTGGEDNIAANRATSTSDVLISSLLGYTVDGCALKSAVVPVDYLSIKAWEANDKAILEWVTAHEINHSHFVIEWSKDSYLFEKVGSINSGKQTGPNKKYSFVHEDVIRGKNYYRIKQIDLDGAYEYSEVKVVQIDAGQRGDYILYPNPAKDRLTINLNTVENYPLRLEIISMDGKSIGEELIYPGSSKYEMDVSDLAQGLYFIRLNGKTTRFIKG